MLLFTTYNHKTFFNFLGYISSSIYVFRHSIIIVFLRFFIMRIFLRNRSAFQLTQDFLLSYHPPPYRFFPHSVIEYLNRVMGDNKKLFSFISELRFYQLIKRYSILNFPSFIGAFSFSSILPKFSSCVHCTLFSNIFPFDICFYSDFGSNLSLHFISKFIPIVFVVICDNSLGILQF